ncbi:hypothetical protein ABG067_008522, partial [Albugo candida]
MLDLSDRRCHNPLFRCECEKRCYFLRSTVTDKYYEDIIYMYLGEYGPTLPTYFMGNATNKGYMNPYEERFAIPDINEAVNENRPLVNPYDIDVILEHGEPAEEEYEPMEEDGLEDETYFNFLHYKEYNFETSFFDDDTYAFYHEFFCEDISSEEEEISQTTTDQE